MADSVIALFCVGFLIGSLVAIAIVGIITANKVSKLKDDEEHEYRPSIEQVLIVLSSLPFLYKFTPHEKDCVNEAHRLIEEMQEKKEKNESIMNVCPFYDEYDCERYDCCECELNQEE